MGTAIKHRARPDLSRHLYYLTSGHSDAQGWASECLDVKKYKWRLNPVWHRMLYSCTRMATVGVKGLTYCTVSPVHCSCWRGCCSVISSSTRQTRPIIWWCNSRRSPPKSSLHSVSTTSRPSSILSPAGQYILWSALQFASVLQHFVWHPVPTMMTDEA